MRLRVQYNSPVVLTFALLSLGALVLGALTGGLTSAAGGITAAVVFGLVAALLFRPGNKR